MSGWNVNAPSFVPNANAPRFVPGQPYQFTAPPPVAEQQSDQQEWDAEPEPAPNSPVEAPRLDEPSEPELPIKSESKDPSPPTDDEKKEAKDVIAPLTRKFERATIDSKSRKEHVNIVFIGHVDAGKSTIGGQIMYQTGMVDKRTLEKYEKDAKEKGRESWYLSWCMDTNEEEREKGKLAALSLKLSVNISRFSMHLVTNRLCQI